MKDGASGSVAHSGCRLPPVVSRNSIRRKLLRSSVSIALVAVCVTSVQPVHSQDKVRGHPLLYTVPFRAGQNGYRIFRIPALWNSPQKPVLAFAEGRVDERRMRGNIDIVLRRSFDYGQTWGPMQVVVSLGDDACGNPCVVQDESNGRLWLAFTRSRQQDTEELIVAGKVPGTTVWITYSDDAGATWADARDISASARRPGWGWYGTGPGRGLYLRTGRGDESRILIPAYHTQDGVYRTHCLFSEDRGQTWRLGGIAADHSSEPQIVVVENRTLVMNARTITGHGDHRTLYLSGDLGRTWKPAEGLATLLENQCQGDFYRCLRAGSSGQADWIFTHPIRAGRVNVHAWISEDGGKSWPHAQPLWSGPSAYTSMHRIHDLVGLLMECGEQDTYEQIAFVKFALEWLKAGKAPAQPPAQGPQSPRVQTSPF